MGIESLGKSDKWIKAEESKFDSVNISCCHDDIVKFPYYVFGYKYIFITVQIKSLASFSLKVVMELWVGPAPPPQKSGPPNQIASWWVAHFLFILALPIHTSHNHSVRLWIAAKVLFPSVGAVRYELAFQINRRAEEEIAAQLICCTGTLTCAECHLHNCCCPLLCSST